MDANETLKILIEQGIVNADSLKQAEIMQKERRAKLLHDYKFYQLPNGQWKTYLPTSNGRKELRSKSKEILLDKIIAYYSAEDQELFFDNLTFSKLFDEWLEYKSTITESPNTIRRHIQHYNKYFRSVFGSRAVKTLDYLSLQALCNSLVKEYHMTSKEWVNVKTILKGMFELAFEKGYIKTNPVPRIKITVKFRQENHKTGKTETFNTEEYNSLMEWLDEKISENFHPGIFAIKVNFFLGLRVGELVALRWSDIEEDNLHVMREEYRDQETGRVTVVEHTKTHSDRYVPIIPDAMAIFYKLYKKYNPSKDDYIFVHNGKRLTARQVAYLLEKFAKEKNISTKSSHKIRKTYASMLQASGVPIDEIKNLLGHSSIETTLKYLYNPLTTKETRIMVENALSVPKS